MRVTFCSLLTVCMTTIASLSFAANSNTGKEQNCIALLNSEFTNIEISKSLTQLTKQEIRHLIDQGAALQALRTAPPELKQKIKTEWQSVFREFNLGWTYPALDVLTALNSDTTEAQNFVRSAIHDYIKRAPRRATTNLLTDRNQLQLPASGAVASDSNPQVLTTFTEKYQLNKYAEVTRRIFAEILPPEFSGKSMLFAEWDRNFSSMALGEAFRSAFEMGLTEEMSILLQLMLIHERFDDLGDAAELLKDDQLILRLGTYMLSKFYYDTNHPYYYNKLWDAIETLKRVQGAEARKEFRQLMIDLTNDILSDDFYNKLLAHYNGDATETQSHMGVLLSNLLRGLQSSGEILHLENEDSIKTAYYTRTADPKIKNAVRNVIAYAEQKNIRYVSDSAKREALQSTQDLKWLLLRAKDLEAANNYQAIEFYLAAGDVGKAVSLLFKENTTPKADKYYISDLLKIAYIAGVQDQFVTALNEKAPQARSVVAEMLAKNAAERFKPEVKMNRGNYVANQFYYYLKSIHDGQTRTAKESLSNAHAYQAAKNNLNAGVQFMDAAFGIYLGQD